MDFIPDLGPILAFTLAAFVLAITPGPDMTLFLGRTIAEGRAAGITAMLGAASGILVHTTLAAFGLSALIAASPEAFAALKIGGRPTSPISRSRRCATARRSPWKRSPASGIRSCRTG